MLEYAAVRKVSESLCGPLEIEDYGIQSMPDASPPKWHLAHTTWFFETFVLLPHLRGYRVFDETFGLLFNSYYQSAGSFYPRAQRGLLARPTVEDVYRYRTHVDGAMMELLIAQSAEARDEIAFLTELGLNHEQQHQELLLTDIQHNFSVNPLHPIYRPEQANAKTSAAPLRWVDFPGGLREIGASDQSFFYDNETPRHRVFLRPYRLATRLTTAGEYLEFIDSGGYRRPEFWLSDGWSAIQRQSIEAPLYWEKVDGAWWRMGLGGFRPVDEHEPVCHVSFYEADAYARFRGRRLPSEAEWECAAAGAPKAGNFVESGRLRPTVAADCEPGTLAQIYGDAWEWTQSAYAPYPGFRPLAGSLGEYNGKFMCNQMVLRGGSCATPESHIRASYRNFFYPADRWQFSGIRLADDAS